MSFEQVSKYIYADLSYSNSKDQTHLVANVFKMHWELLDLNFSEKLLSAFIHKSFKHENTNLLEHSEKLEFFGDSVLQLLVSEYLYIHFKDLSEGDLSKFRSQLVNEQSLAQLARSFELSKWILVGKGELKENGQNKSSILSDTFEALLGAIYFESGLDQARNFLLSCFRNFEQTKGKSFLDFARENSQDAKTLLQEKVMKKFKTTPEYKTTNVKAEGRDAFQVELWVQNQSLGRETHASKKRAMQLVAKKALENNLI